MFLKESYRTVKMQRYNGMTCFVFLIFFGPIYKEEYFCVFSLYTYSVCTVCAEVARRPT